MSDKEIENIFLSKPSYRSKWFEEFPGKESEIEEFLKIFCDNFWVSPDLWEHFSPNDEINIVYNMIYPKGTKWWQIEDMGDNLEHNFWTRDLEETTGKVLTEEVYKSIESIGDCFKQFYIN